MSASARADRLRGRFDELNIDTVIISSEPNVRYVTGFSGEGWAIVDESTAVITDGRYTLRAEREAPDVELIRRSGSMKDAVIERLSANGAKRVGFEADHLTVSERDDLQDDLDGVELVPLKGVLRKDRMVKDADEVELLRRAIAITDEAFAKVAEGLEPGISEKELALEVQRQLLLAGADELSFPVIAACGPNSADPHAEPTDRALAMGDNVKLDFGGGVAGYHADLTRTVFLGEPDDKQREIYKIVLEAQRQATEACKPEALCKDVDAVARELIKETAYGEAFSHGLGHGVGLQVHEGPGLAHTSEDTLVPGMCVTIEPGIYLKDWGGVRIEDIVLITEDGHEILTSAPKLDLA